MIYAAGAVKIQEEGRDMKRILALLAAIVLCIGCAQAEPRTIDLDTMTVEELEALKTDVSKAIVAASIENVDGYIVVNDYNEYARSPELHADEQIRFNGSVVQVVEGVENTIYRIAVNGNLDNIFYVTLAADSQAQRVLENDEVTVFGTFGGLFTYESTLGGSITIPSCIAEKITEKIVEEGEYPATRQDPAPIGATVRYDGSSYSNKCVTDLTITNIIKGDAAWQIVHKWNRWNDKPSEDQQYVIVYIRTDAISAENDQQATIDSYDFVFVSENGVEYERASVSGKTPELTDLYPGASHEGIVVGLVKKDDNPRLVYLKSSDKPIWFDLNKRVPIVLPDDMVFTTLEKGAKGDDVMRLQAMLIEMGYLSGTADGDFGGKTQAAIAQYQIDMGLESTGIADEATQRLILTATYPEK